MTDTIRDPEVFMDSGIEWRLLNKLLLPENRDWINRISPELFTGQRINVHRAMQLSFVEYGNVSYEGIHRFLDGKVPGELTAATQGDLYALIDQAIRLATKRQLRTTANRLAELSKQYDPSKDDIRTAMDVEPIMAEQDSGLAMGAQSFMGDLHAKRSGDYIFARTGFKVLDRNMGGEWKPKGLIIMAGGTGSGKTTFWTTIQKKMAQGYISQHGERIQTPSLFFSLEMSKADLISKMIGDELSIDTQLLASGNFQQIVDDSDGLYETEDDVIRAIEDKMVDLQQLPMYIIDDGRINMAQIVYQIRKHVHRYGVRVVAIDYLQIVNHAPTGNKNSDLGQIAQVLKEVAKRENITIILLSQINDKEGVDIIRDSGEVRAVADVIMQLIPEDDDGLVSASAIKYVYIGIWKNRYGGVGKKYPVYLHGPHQRFMEELPRYD